MAAIAAVARKAAASVGKAASAPTLGHGPLAIQHMGDGGGTLDTLGTFALAALYVLTWQRARGPVQAILPSLLQGMPPGSAYFAMFGYMFVELVVICIIIALVLVMWQYVVNVEEASRKQQVRGPERAPATSALSVFVGGVVRTDTLLLLLYSSAATFIYTYAYMIALHSRRAPLRDYREMVDQAFRFNLILTLGCLAFFLMTAPS